MTESRKKTAARILLFSALLLLSYILQGLILNRHPIFGAKPLILPFIAVGAAVFFGRVKGGIVGIAAGFLMDIAYNQPTIMFTLTLAFIGLIAGYLVETVLVKGLFAYAVSALAALIICFAVEAVSYLIVGGASASAVFDVGLRQTAASALFAIPVYYIVLGISKLV
ncbi:MAG: hypothetical protein II583_06690 [Oscillospiraceae bacterium]|nr:hypothetical protein [Oscillospiraceae bacterium]